MYHLKCYTKFKRKVEKSKKEEKNTDFALIYILEELKKTASKGDVLQLDDVWYRYENYAREFNTESTGLYKNMHTFCICLKQKTGGLYHFVNKLADRKTIMYPINHLNEGISTIIEKN